MPERSDAQSTATLLLAVTLGLATVGLFGRAVRYGFLQYDDQLYVTDQPVVRQGLSLAGVFWAFQPSHIVGGNWHPLTVVSHMLDVTWFGLNPAGHHAHSVVLHALNTVLLFLALRSLSGQLWPSLVVAAIWGWHPLRVESVAWIAERKDVLSGLFWMLALVAYASYARRPAWSRYALVGLCLLLGLLSKPMVVTLPAVLLLLDFWPVARYKPRGNREEEKLASNPPVRGLRAWRRGSLPQRWGWLVIEKLPLLALSAAFSLLTIRAQHAAGSIAAVADSPLWLRANNALQSYVAYLTKTFWPVDLAVLYPLRGRNFEWYEAAAAGAVVIAVTGVTMLAARRRPWAAVGWLWYLGTLVPVIGLIQVGSQAMADRYTYLPQIGIMVAVVWTLWHGAARVAPHGAARMAGAVLLAGWLAVSAVLTWQQLGYWRDTKTLFAHAIEITRRNYYGHYMVANQLVLQGKLDEALRHYDAALAIKPNFHEAHYNKGLALLFGGQSLQDAAGHLAMALETGHDPAPTELMLGRCLALMNRNAAAEPHLRRAVELDPTNQTALTGLGTVWLRLERPEEATALYRRVLRQSPSLVAENARVAGHLAWILATHPRRRSLDGTSALNLATGACRAGGEDDPWLLGALAAAQAEAGRYDAALVSATRALRWASQAERQPGFEKEQPPAAYAQWSESLRRQIARYQRRLPYRDVPANSPLW